MAVEPIILIGQAWRALSDAGIDVTPDNAHHVRLRWHEWRDRLRIHPSARVLNPRDIARLTRRHDEPGLLLLPSVTERTREAITGAGWSWLVIGLRGAHGSVRIGDATVHIDETQAHKPARPSRRTGPIPWGQFTLIRRLLDQPPSSQARLAKLTGVTQPRVSQILADLASHGLVHRRTGGWAVADAPALLRRWLDSYPGPGGIDTYWAGLGAPWEQAKAAVDRITRGTPGGQDRPAVVASGDLGADLIAPWRTPTRAILYARTGHDLNEVGLTPVAPDEATLELIVPEDPGVWPAEPGAAGSVGEQAANARPRNGQAATTGSATSRRKPVTLPDVLAADPLQVLWDVQRTGGPAADEAARRLIDAILARATTSQDPA